jgi:hypothetical protein
MAVFTRQVNCYNCGFMSHVIRVKLSCANWEPALWAVFINKDEFELFTGVTHRKMSSNLILFSSWCNLFGVSVQTCPVGILHMHFPFTILHGAMQACIVLAWNVGRDLRHAFNGHVITKVLSIFITASILRLIQGEFCYLSQNQPSMRDCRLVWLHIEGERVFPIFSLIEISVDSNQWMSTYSGVFIKSVFHWSVLQPPIWRGLNSVRRNNFLISVCQLQNLSVKNSWEDDYSHCQKVDH